MELQCQKLVSVIQHKFKIPCINMCYKIGEKKTDGNVQCILHTYGEYSNRQMALLNINEDSNMVAEISI